MKSAEYITTPGDTASIIYKRMHRDPPPYMEHVTKHGACYNVVPFEWLMCQM